MRLKFLELPSDERRLYIEQAAERRPKATSRTPAATTILRFTCAFPMRFLLCPICAHSRYETLENGRSRRRGGPLTFRGGIGLGSTW